MTCRCGVNALGLYCLTFDKFKYVAETDGFVNALFETLQSKSYLETQPDSTATEVFSVVGWKYVIFWLPSGSTFYLFVPDHRAIVPYRVYPCGQLLWNSKQDLLANGLPFSASTIENRYHSNSNAVSLGSLLSAVQCRTLLCITSISSVKVSNRNV